MNRAETTALAATAQAAMDAAGITDALVTLDATDAPSAAQAGGSVAVIGPPSLTYTTQRIVQSTWTVWLVAGPRLEQGWPRLDAMLAALAEPLDLDTAEPDALTGSTGSSYPAYRATTTATYTL